jgi:hypothetical protein
MTPEEFDALFDDFRHTVFRLEALPAYNVGGTEAERLTAFREGWPLAERSVRTDPWVARIAVSTVVGGKEWLRARVVDDPLTEYERFELEAYRESQAVGEQIRIVRRTRVGDVGPDFWLFDTGTQNARAVLMRYDDEGHWLGADLITEPDELATLNERRERVLEGAVPLNQYLAEIQSEARG